MGKEITVFITGAGTATSQSVIKGLRGQRELKVRLITADMSADNAGRYMSDLFCKIPPAGHEDFLPAVLGICARENVRLLIPVIDYEFEKLSKSRQQFSHINCTVAISGPQTVATATDKWLTYQFFQKNNIPAARTFLPEQLNGRDLDFPVFIKPRKLGRASLNTLKADCADQMRMHLDKNPDSIIQEFIKGEEFTIDTLSDLNGSFIAAAVRKRIAVKAGVSYKGVTVNDEEIKNIAAVIANALPLAGAANIQCFRSGEKIYFSEINPRFSGGLALSLAAGFNSPLGLAKLALGEKLNPADFSCRPDVTMLRYWNEIFVDGNGVRISPADTE